MGNKQSGSSSGGASSSGSGTTNRTNFTQRNNQSLYIKAPMVVPLNREKSKIRRRCSELRVSPNLSNGGGGAGISTISSNSSFDTPSTSELRPPLNGLNSDFNRQSRRRWSSAAMIGNRNNISTKPKRLLPRQCHLIIKSWNKKIPKNRIVKDIFCSIFNEAEELKKLFGIAENMKGKKLRSDPKFMAHVNLFVDTLDFVIRNLDDISMVNENAEQLGRRHVSILTQGDFSFKPEYWNIFTECILENATSSEEDKETQMAWRQLILNIIFYMKLGYERESLRIVRHASMNRSNTPTIIINRLPFPEV